MHRIKKNLIETERFIRFIKEKLLFQDVLKYRLLPRGSASVNYVITTASEKFLIKLCFNQTPDSIERLVKIYETLSKNLSVPTAEPVRIDGKAYFVYEDKYACILKYMVGKSLPYIKMRLSDFDKILTTYSNFLKTNWPEKNIILPAINWTKRYRETARKLKAMLRNDAQTLSGITIKTMILKHCYLSFLKIKVSKESVSQTSVIHGDFHNNNILFKRHQLTAFLDFEECRMGCISEDLVRYILCFVSHSCFIILPNYYLIKWIQLVNKRFRLSSEEWLWGLHAFFITRMERCLLEAEQTRLSYKSIMKCYLILWKYRFMYRLFHYLLDKVFFVK